MTGQRRVILLLSILLTLVFSVTACGGSNPPVIETATPEETAEPTPSIKESINIVMMKDAGGVSLAKLEFDAASGVTKGNYHFSVQDSIDTMSVLIKNGKFDIAELPVNAAAALSRKGNALSVVALSSLDSVYLLTDSSAESVSGIKDLSGKNIFAVGKGTNTEYVLHSVLSANGIVPKKDAEISYFPDNSASLTKIITEKYPIVVATEPLVSSLMSINNNYKISLNLSDIFLKTFGVSGGGAGTCIVASKNMVENYSDSLDIFLDEYKASVDYILSEDRDAVSGLLVNSGFFIDKESALGALSLCKICCITGNDMQKRLTPFLIALYNYDINSVGGYVAGADFYYKK